MKLANYIKPKPLFFNFIPHLGKYTANSLYPFILIPKAIYDDLKTENPNPNSVALLIHEETHRKRQKELGWLIFAIKYMFNPVFRFNEEILAIKEAMRYLKKYNMPFDLDRKAKTLSSWLYLWPVSRDFAKKELEKIWNETQ